MAEIISWVATAATILAALMTASNLGSRITGYGFCVFLVGSLAWLANAWMTQQTALVWTNAVLTLLNIFGIWRWLGRQARVEEGAGRAAEKSEHLPGDTLFPASLLTSAKLIGSDGRELGSLVDAMAGCRSGRLRYLVVSAGGVAGVGETLRRVDWDGVTMDEGAVRAELDERTFAAAPALSKDNWPGQ